MTDAVLAIVFILMLLTPCASGMLSDRRREEDLEAARAEKRALEQTQGQTVTRQTLRKQTVVEKRIVERRPFPATTAEIRKLVPAPVAPAFVEAKLPEPVPAYKPLAEMVFHPVVQKPERAFFESAVSFEPLGIARRAPGTESGPGSLLQRRAEMAEADALMAKVEAARADAAMLLALARAAANKAYVAAQAAAQAEREMQEAAEAAAMARARYTRTHSLEGPSTPLPATHPSLDFPRSRTPRRAA